MLSDELEVEIQAGQSFGQIFETLKGLRQAGDSRDEVLRSLQSLRDRTADEATDDRILEVMDIVSGFCRLEDSIWEDEPR